MPSDTIRELSDDEPDRFNLLPKEEQEAVRTWIAAVMQPYHRPDESHTSRDLWDAYRAFSGSTLSHGAFKGAMKLGGYVPTKETAYRKDWAFCVQPLSTLPIPRQAPGKGYKHWRRSRATEAYTTAHLNEAAQRLLCDLVRHAVRRLGPMPIYPRGDVYVVGEPAPVTI